MNSPGIYKFPTEDSFTLSNRQKTCIRCGRRGHLHDACHASTNTDGKKLNYCQCLRCR